MRGRALRGGRTRRGRALRARAIRVRALLGARAIIVGPHPPPFYTSSLTSPPRSTRIAFPFERGAAEAARHVVNSCHRHASRFVRGGIRENRNRIRGHLQRPQGDRGPRGPGRPHDRRFVPGSTSRRSRGASHFCLVALGGYGRRALFPFSDIDLMFLAEDQAAESRYRDATRTISRTLWDLRLRLSPTNRRSPSAKNSTATMRNSTFRCSTARYLAGDARLFSRLRRRRPSADDRARTAGGLLSDISELTRQRHEKEGDTIFHLEPNLKNSPGGLRDYHVACWVALIFRERSRRGAEPPETLWSAEVTGEEMRKAFDFLAAARCFLHYRQGRDDNGLSYELQAEAALGASARAHAGHRASRLDARIFPSCARHLRSLHPVAR